MRDIFHDFLEYCRERNWTLDRYTSEFTIQFRLARYLDTIGYGALELESNTHRYGVTGLVKKEIDIDADGTHEGHVAIEIKYVRDPSSHDISIFSICQDLRFLEELVALNFDKGYALVFTSLDTMLDGNADLSRIKYPERVRMMEQFKIRKELSGQIEFVIGAKRSTIVLQGLYPITWNEVAPGYWACLMEVSRQFATGLA